MKDEIKALMKKKKNFKNVLEGWTNLAKDTLNQLSKEDKEIALKRKEICESCIFYSKNAINMLEYKTTLVYDHCSVCKCPIPAKVMSLNSNCGLEEFSFNPNDEDLKHVKKYYEENNEPIQWRWLAKNTPMINVNFNEKLL